MEVEKIRGRILEMVEDSDRLKFLVPFRFKAYGGLYLSGGCHACSIAYTVKEGDVDVEEEKVRLRGEIMDVIDKVISHGTAGEYLPRVLNDMEKIVENGVKNCDWWVFE